MVERDNWDIAGDKRGGDNGSSRSGGGGEQDCCGLGTMCERGGFIWGYGTKDRTGREEGEWNALEEIWAMRAQPIADRAKGADLPAVIGHLDERGGDNSSRRSLGGGIPIHTVANRAKGVNMSVPSSSHVETRHCVVCMGNSSLPTGMGTLGSIPTQANGGIGSIAAANALFKIILTHAEVRVEAPAIPHITPTRRNGDIFWL